MNAKWKGWLIYFTGCAIFCVACVLLLVLKARAGGVGTAIFLLPLVPYVSWVYYLSGLTFDTHKPFWKRLVMVFGSTLAACGFIWFSCAILSSLL